VRDLMSRADLTRTSERNLLSGLATTTVIGTTYFALVIAAMHFIRPDINPIERPTSEYAVGPFGYVMTSAFLSLSVGRWTLVLGVRRDLPYRGPLRTGTMCLALWGVGLLVAATFSDRPGGRTFDVSVAEAFAYITDMKNWPEY